MRGALFSNLVEIALYELENEVEVVLASNYLVQLDDVRVHE